MTSGGAAVAAAPLGEGRMPTDGCLRVGPLAQVCSSPGTLWRAGVDQVGLPQQGQPGPPARVGALAVWQRRRSPPLAGRSVPLALPPRAPHPLCRAEALEGRCSHTCHPMALPRHHQPPGSRSVAGLFWLALAVALGTRAVAAQCGFQCISCDTAGPGKCDQCDDGYGPTASGACAAVSLLDARALWVALGRGTTVA